MFYWLIGAIESLKQSQFGKAVGGHVGFEVVVPAEDRGNEAAAAGRVLDVQLAEQFAVLEADALGLEAG